MTQPYLPEAKKYPTTARLPISPVRPAIARYADPRHPSNASASFATNVRISCEEKRRRINTRREKKEGKTGGKKKHGQKRKHNDGRRMRNLQTRNTPRPQQLNSRNYQTLYLEKNKIHFSCNEIETLQRVKTHPCKRQVPKREFVCPKAGVGVYSHRVSKHGKHYRPAQTSAWSKSTIYT